MRKISFIFIIVGFIGIQVITLIPIYQKEVNKQIVSKIEVGEYKEKNYYVGYIAVCSIKIPLVYGSSEKELNQNLVGIDNHSTSNHLILAGHAIKSVFLCLYDVKVDDIIKIKYHNSNYIYYIDNKKIVNYTDISVYNNTGLTLITCINKEQRLIVHAKTAS